MHPLNLALRFILELAALAGFAVATWSLAIGLWKYGAVISVLALLGTLWGVFAVPGDPSRSGNAPVQVSGRVRLALELVILLGGACAFVWAGFRLTGFLLIALVALHYGLSGPRLRWLLRR